MMTQPIQHSSLPSEYRSARPGPATRARRILGARLRFIDHPSFAEPTVPVAIPAAPSESVNDGAGRLSESPTRLSPLPTDRFQDRLLSRDQEAHLFRKMNYLKSRANRLREELDPNRPNPGDLDEIERLLSEAADVKNQVVEMNLRLVVSIARTRVGPGYDLHECLSDGNLALVKAVDGFDFARGNRFSTYATLAIRRHLGRNRYRSIRRVGRSLVPYERFLTAPDPGLDEHEREEVRDRMMSALMRWFGRLEERERRVIANRYGIGGGSQQTLTQIGQQLGISKERVCQIEVRARAKLRKWARLEGIEPMAI